jgi:hypothetical protein
MFNRSAGAGVWPAGLLADIRLGVARPGRGLATGRRVLALLAACLLALAAAAAAVPSAAAGLPWSVAASPNIPGGANDLYAVAGSSPADVWAVGGYAGVPNGPVLPLAEHWGGSSWQVVPAARPAGGDATLFAVAVLSPTDAWAIGDNRGQQYPNTDHSLIEHWNGAAWRIAAAPSPQAGYLTSVAAVSPADVWAAGNQFNVAASAFEPLFEHWNGQRWSMVTGPAAGVPSRISAVTGSDVWAIGERYATSPAGLPVVRPIIYHFDGTRWRVQATPALTAEYGYGDVGIEAVSASDVWAFVLHGVRGGATPVFLHWNGTAWTQIAGAALVTSDSYESFGLAFTGTANGWFLGNHTNSGDILAEHWDGTSWSAATLPNWGDLYAIAAVPHGPFWAVGAFVDPSAGYTQTRILHGP